MTGGSIGGNDRHFQFINLELHFFQSWFLSSLLILDTAKQVLISNSRQSLSFRLNLYPFFRFNRLVQSTPATSWQHPTRKLIHDYHFTVADDIVHVLRNSSFALIALKI